MRKRKRENQKGKKRTKKEKEFVEERSSWIERGKRKDIEKEGKGKGRFPGFLAVEVRRSEYESWYTQRDLRVDIKNLEFRQTL